MKMADGHALAGFVITSAVARGDFLQLPVHARGAVVVNLDAIHAELRSPVSGSRVTTHGQRDETSAIQRPAFQDGQIEQRWRRIGLKCPFCQSARAASFSAGGRRVKFMNHVLARAGLHGFRFGMAQIQREARAA
jgi:hypothetical protein